MARPIQVFEVGLKAFIVRERRLLVLREAGTGYWEIPGGRIDVGEEARDQKDVLRREIREELGEHFDVEMGPLVTTWIRRRPTDFVFLVGRLCRHRAGEPTLSHEHVEHAWVDESTSATLALAPGYAESLAEFWRVLPSLT